MFGWPRLNLRQSTRRFFQNTILRRSVLSARFEVRGANYCSSIAVITWRGTQQARLRA
jgi:hypothetical protein